jgi:hypothetical protein
LFFSREFLGQAFDIADFGVVRERFAPVGFVAVVVPDLADKSTSCSSDSNGNAPSLRLSIFGNRNNQQVFCCCFLF